MQIVDHYGFTCIIQPGIQKFFYFIIPEMMQKQVTNNHGVVAGEPWKIQDVFFFNLSPSPLPSSTACLWFWYRYVGILETVVPDLQPLDLIYRP